MRANRGRKYTVHENEIKTKKFFNHVRKVGTTTTNYTSNPHNNYSYNAGNINNTVNYYSKNAKVIPRSKTNSKKRGVILKGKDSRNMLSSIAPGGIRPNRNNMKRVPANYAYNQGRIRSTNNRSILKDRIKTIDYNDSNFKSLVARSNTAQKRRKLNIQNNFSGHGHNIKPYSNFGPSNNTRSNITIERSGSLVTGKGNKNPTSISYISNAKTSSKKVFGPINEYEDDSVMTVNSNYGKNNTIMEIKNNNDCNLTINSVKNKVSNKEIGKRPKFNKVSTKEMRSKSNKRVNRSNFERVYLHSPNKLFKNGHSQVKLRKNISNNESKGSLVETRVNLRDKTVSPTIPRVNGAIAVNSRHKTTIKDRPPQKFNNSMKHEVSSINTSKDPSRLNFAIMKHAVSYFVS